MHDLGTAEATKNAFQTSAHHPPLRAGSSLTARNTATHYSLSTPQPVYERLHLSFQGEKSAFGA